jgi:hypothetical protein
MKTIFAVVIALVVGGIGGSVLTAHRDAKEMHMRAHYASALFRVAERHIAHETLVAEWGAEARLGDSENLRGCGRRRSPQLARFALILASACFTCQAHEDREEGKAAPMGYIGARGHA